MKKFVVFIFLILSCFLSGVAMALYGHFDEFDKPEEVKNIEMIIPAKSFFRGFMGQTVSSEFNNSGDMVKILIQSDFTIDDKVILPKNSVFVGVVKNLEKAQRGLNGYFSIDIVGLVFPDGRQFNAKGYIVSSKNNRTFGGELTRRAGHKTTLHRASPNGKYGVLELKQNGPRIMGKETKILMGEFVTIVLEEAIDVE